MAFASPACSVRREPAREQCFPKEEEEEQGVCVFLKWQVHRECSLAQNQPYIPSPLKHMAQGCFQGWMGMEEGLCIPFSEPCPSGPGARWKGLTHHLNLCVGPLAFSQLHPEGCGSPQRPMSCTHPLRCSSASVSLIFQHGVSCANCRGQLAKLVLVP